MSEEKQLEYVGDKIGDDIAFHLYVNNGSGDISFSLAAPDSGEGKLAVYCPAELEETVAKHIGGWWRGIHVHHLPMFAGRQVPMSELQVDVSADQVGSVVSQIVNLMGKFLRGRL